MSLAPMDTPWKDIWLEQPATDYIGRFFSHPEARPGPGAICRWCRKELEQRAIGTTNVVECPNCDRPTGKSMA